MARHGGGDLAGIDREPETEWLKYLNRQGDWLEKTRGNLMVVATVIASMSFQGMVNPPSAGDKTSQTSPGSSPAPAPAPASTCTIKVGRSVVVNDCKHLRYVGFLISNTVSFSASLGLILLVISGLRLRNRFVMFLLILLMVVAVFGIVTAFWFSVALGPSDDLLVEFVLLGYLVFWVVFPAIIIFVQLVRFLVWVLCLVFPFCKPKRRPVQWLRPQSQDQATPSA